MGIQMNRYHEIIRDAIVNDMKAAGVNGFPALHLSDLLVALFDLLVNYASLAPDAKTEEGRLQMSAIFADLFHERLGLTFAEVSKMFEGGQCVVVHVGDNSPLLRRADQEAA